MHNEGDSTHVVDDAVRHDFSSCGPADVDQADGGVPPLNLTMCKLKLQIKNTLNSNASIKKESHTSQNDCIFCKNATETLNGHFKLSPTRNPSNMATPTYKRLAFQA